MQQIFATIRAEIFRIGPSKLAFFLLIAIVASVVNILHVLTVASKTPDGLQYLFTGHYYLDYFTYVQAIAQGMRGEWLVSNPFATDDPSVLFAWWPYILLGKVAVVTGMSAIGIYWLSVFVLSVMFALGASVLIARLVSPSLRKVPYVSAAFLLFLTATPFINFTAFFRSGTIEVYDFFYAPNMLFRRFGNIPYHLMSSLVLLCVIFLTARILKKIRQDKYPMRLLVIHSLGLSLVMTVLLTFSPFAVITLFGTILLTAAVECLRAMRSKKFTSRILIRYFLFGGVVVAVVVPVSLFIKFSYGQAEIFARASEWELSQIMYPTFKRFIQLMGPLIPFSILGLPVFVRRFTVLRLVSVSFVIVSFALFLSPVSQVLGSHNWRFLTPLHYVFFAALTVEGFAFISKKTVKSLALVVPVSMVLIAFFAPVTYTILTRHTADTNLATNISYLPTEMDEVFEVLEQYPKDSVVLTAPYQFFGVLVPVFTEKRVYVGRDLSTPNFWVKAEIVERLLTTQMTEEEAKEFIQETEATTLLLTHIDAYDREALLQYPFFEKVYENSVGTLYEINL